VWAPRVTHKTLAEREARKRSAVNGGFLDGADITRARFREKTSESRMVEQKNSRWAEIVSESA
jgi:hypothetical protein